ncbi:MAG: oligosaccharide flippase family protein [Flammeovirgaceae bacterium]
MNSFIKIIIITLFANLIVKVVWVLGVEVYVQNVIGTELYGTYYTCLSLSFVFSFLLDFGFSRYNAIATARNGTVLHQEYSEIFKLKIYFSIGYLILSFLLSLLLGYSLNLFIILLVLCLSQIFSSYILLFRSVFSGSKNFLWEVIASVLDRALMIGFFVVAFLSMNSSWSRSLNAFILIQLLGNFLSFSLLGMVVSKVYNVYHLSNVKFEIKNNPVILSTLPFTLLIGLEMLTDKSSIIILERSLANGSIEAGKYAFGLRWLDAYKMFASLLAVVILPYYAQNLASRKEIQKLMKIGFTGIFCVTASIVIFLCGFSRELVDMLTNQPSDELRTIFVINVITFLPYTSIYVTQPLLSLELKINKLNMIFAFSLLLNVVGVLILAPILKAVGVGVVYACSIFYIGLAQLWHCRSFLTSGGSYSMLAKNAVRWVLFISIQIVVVVFLPKQNPVISLCAFSLISISTVFALQLVSLKQLQEIANFKRNQPNL